MNIPCSLLSVCPPLWASKSGVLCCHFSPTPEGQCSAARKQQCTGCRTAQAPLRYTLQVRTSLSPQTRGLLLSHQHPRARTPQQQLQPRNMAAQMHPQSVQSGHMWAVQLETMSMSCSRVHKAALVAQGQSWTCRAFAAPTALYRRTAVPTASSCWHSNNTGIISILAPFLQPSVTSNQH
jgi:hypothetical protein